MSAEFIEYEVFVPTTNLQGLKFEEQVIAKIKNKVIEYFGGITDTRHFNEGVWKIGPLRIRDEILIWRILSDKGPQGDQFVREVKRELEELLNQDQVMVVRRNVQIL